MSKRATKIDLECDPRWLELHARMRRQLPAEVAKLRLLLDALTQTPLGERGERWQQLERQAHQLRGRAAILELAALNSAAERLERLAGGSRDERAARALLSACKLALSDIA